MARRLQKFDNSHDRQCFACGLLWEDTNHVLRYPGEARSTAQGDETFRQFRIHLTRQNTPDILADILCATMQRWISCHPISPTTWPLPCKPIHCILVSQAFTAQTKIGWDQFLRGHIATSWKSVIQLYYQERKPGDKFTPDQWMRTAIEAIWTFALTLWRHCNKELHGEDGTLS